MKVLVVTLIGLFSFSSFATSYCYDSAMMATDQLKREILACDPSLPTKPLDVLSDRLYGVSMNYTLKVKKAMKEVYKYMYTDLPYGHVSGMSVEVKNCVRELERTTFVKVRLKVLDAMVTCGN